MKTILITFLWLASCLSLSAQGKQEMEDSISVNSYYDTVKKEVVIELCNASNRELYMPQYSIFTASESGAFIQIHSMMEENVYFYGLCQYVDGRYESPKRLYQIKPLEKIKFQTKIQFPVEDVLTIRVHVVCLYFPFSSYVYDKVIEPV